MRVSTIPGRKVYGTREDTAWCTLESDRQLGSHIIGTYIIRIHMIKSLYIWMNSHCFIWEEITTAIRRSLLASQPASLALLQNTHVQHTERLNSLRNHIRLIDNDRTSIDKQQTANASVFIAVTFKSIKSQSSGMNQWDSATQGSGKTSDEGC